MSKLIKCNNLITYKYKTARIYKDDEVIFKKLGWNVSNSYCYCIIKKLKKKKYIGSIIT